MQADAEAKDEERQPDRPASSLASFGENLPRLSVGSRSQSLSPRRRQVKQPLHIRMNLTETQMDKITDA